MWFQSSESSKSLFCGESNAITVDLSTFFLILNLFILSSFSTFTLYLQRSSKHIHDREAMRPTMVKNVYVFRAIINTSIQSAFLDRSKTLKNEVLSKTTNTSDRSFHHHGWLHSSLFSTAIRDKEERKCLQYKFFSIKKRGEKIILKWPIESWQNLSL